MKLDTAIEVFIRERADLNPDSARRWRLELDLFKEQSGKVHLYELTRDDVFAYRKWYKDHGRSDNTIALRTSSLFTFGIRFNVQLALSDGLILPGYQCYLGEVLGNRLGQVEAVYLSDPERACLSE